MIIAMLLAHLVGDYILQWDSLALWKSRALKGVIAHSLVVFVVTWLFALPFNPDWWAGILFIGVAHFLIDAGQLYWKPPVPPLFRFLLDQLAHFVVIGVALWAGGYLALDAIAASAAQLLQNDRLLVILTAYAFITMPAWVLVKFAAYGLVRGSAPEFPGITNKYIGILERLLMATFVGLGQFLLVPLVAVPRVVMEWRSVANSEQTAVYVTELLASTTLAVLVGVALGHLW